MKLAIIVTGLCVLVLLAGVMETREPVQYSLAPFHELTAEEWCVKYGDFCEQPRVNENPLVQIAQWDAVEPNMICNTDNSPQSNECRRQAALKHLEWILDGQQYGNPWLPVPERNMDDPAGDGCNQNIRNSQGEIIGITLAGCLTIRARTSTGCYAEYGSGSTRRSLEVECQEPKGLPVPVCLAKMEEAMKAVDLYVQHKLSGDYSEQPFTFMDATSTQTLWEDAKAQCWKETP